MKASPKGRVRPTILFSQTPHSVSRRAKRLSNRTAAELLRYLCELTVGFGRGSIDLTYRALAEALHKDWSTIARATRLLRALGDVEVETLENGSYRWYVLLEPEDIVADPEGIYRVRAARDIGQTGGPHGKDARGSWQKRHGGHGKNAMGVMAKTPWGDEQEEGLSKPLFIRDEAALEETRKGSLKIFLKDTDLKIHHQIGNVEPAPLQENLAETSHSDDDSLDHQSLFRRLQSVGVKQRMTRKILNKYKHGLIAQVLDRVTSRNDIENPAGYLLRELEDGGYEEIAKPNVTAPNKDHVKPSDAPVAYGTAEQTRAEMARLKAEGEEVEATYRQSVKALFERFQGLTDDALKGELKSCWTRRLETLLPNTPKKSEMMKQEVFKRMAFKEVAERFFGYLDEGLAPELALEQLAA